ncbi:MAG: carboxypeptidase-like regulatory domain-containing protein [Kofleriaceae bacterium]
MQGLRSAVVTIVTIAALAACDRADARRPAPLVTGIVVDGDGRAIAGAAVSLEARTEVTVLGQPASAHRVASDGSFSVASLPSEVVVTVRSPGHAARVIELGGGAADLGGSRSDHAAPFARPWSISAGRDRTGTRARVRGGASR